MNFYKRKAIIKMLKYTCLPFSQLSNDELYRLMALRQEVFIVEQDCPYLDADGKDQEAYHLMGKTSEGLILACARILPPGISYHGYASIGRVVSSLSIRNRGEGHRLMKEALRITKKLYAYFPVKISAQCYLEKFYGQYGFEAMGEPYLEDGIPHIAMILRV